MLCGIQYTKQKQAIANVLMFSKLLAHALTKYKILLHVKSNFTTCLVLRERISIWNMYFYVI
jgi:hypothetical protein